MSTRIPRRLSRAEAAAVHHLLARSALADCPGTAALVVLTDEGDLTLGDLNMWPWSSGEEVLLEVLRFIVGEAVRFPELSKVDDHERLVVREAMRLLCREPAGAS